MVMNPETQLNASGNLIRLLRPSLVILCGPSACGKSTFARKHFRPTQVLSSDWARAMVCDDERDQRFNSQAFDLVHFLVNQRLGLNRLCVLDSTALTAPARKDLLALARKNQVPTTLVVFPVPLETCVARDEKRERSVGRAVIERQYQNFELALNSIRQEGFDQVVELQDADLEKIRFEILFRPVQRPQRSEVRPSTRPDRPGFDLNRRQRGNGAKNTIPVRPIVPAPAQSVTGLRPDPAQHAAPTQTGAINKGRAVPSTVPTTLPNPPVRVVPMPLDLSKKDIA
jgi:predicted kinase